MKLQKNFSANQSESGSKDVVERDEPEEFVKELKKKVARKAIHKEEV